MNLNLANYVASLFGQCVYKCSVFPLREQASGSGITALKDINVMCYDEENEEPKHKHTQLVGFSFACMNPLYTYTSTHLHIYIHSYECQGLSARVLCQPLTHVCMYACALYSGSQRKFL